MHTRRAYWEQRYRLNTNRRVSPTPFALRAADWLKEQQVRLGRRVELLELGAGDSRDARLFAQRGASVVPLDFSSVALRRLAGVASTYPVVADLACPIPFAARSFDAVYTHLVLSCAFSTQEIDHIFEEIYRILRPGGSLWILIRSTEDPTYKRLPQKGPGYYSLGETGLHFYSRRYLTKRTHQFATIHIKAYDLRLDDENYGVLELLAEKPARNPRCP